MAVRERIFRPLMTIILLGSMFLAVFGPRSVKPVWACSCVMPEPPNEAFDRASAVFSGEVTYISGNIGIFSEIRHLVGLSVPYGREVGISVTDSWKGVESKEVVVRTGHGGGDCGYSFDVGKEYLIYAYGDGEYSTGICNRTTPTAASSAADDFRFLSGKPSLILKTESSSSGTVIPIVLGSVLAGGLGLLLFVRWRKESGSVTEVDGGV